MVIADARDLACAILGTTSFRLQGFDAASRAFSKPGIFDIHFVPAPVSALDLVPGFKTRSRSASVLRWVAVVAACFFALTAGATFALWKSESMMFRVAQQAVTDWRIAKVLPDGVSIQIGKSFSMVPTGGRLPNGDTIVAVDPAKSAVVLQSGVLLVRPK